MPTSYALRQELNKIGLTAAAWLVAMVTAFPLFWMVSSSLKPTTEVMATPPTWFPAVVTFDSYLRVLSQTDFLSWFRSSVIVAVSTTAVVIVTGTLGAYSLTRFRYPGQNVVAITILFTYFFPPVLMLIPLFLIISQLGLMDTYFALILANATFTLPFAIWLLRTYFQSIPVQIEEAAIVDGASRMRAFVDVVLPQALPGIISTSIFSLIHTWNDYLFALVFISTASRKTLPLGIAGYANELYTEWGPLMASSVLVTVPTLIFFIILQRRLISGFGAGAVKG